MITEDYVSFETAKLLKEKGFPQDPSICNTAYTSNGKFSNNAKSFCHNVELFNQCGVKPVSYSMAPTLQMAMKWLREVHNIHFLLSPFFTKEGNVVYSINVLDKEMVGSLYDNLDENTYEEACEAAIKYCLENLI